MIRERIYKLFVIQIVLVLVFGITGKILQFVKVPMYFHCENGEIIGTSWHDTYEVICSCMVYIFLGFFVLTIFMIVAAKIHGEKRLLRKALFAFVLFFISWFVVECCKINVTGWEDLYETKYYEFTDGKHTIVIGEGSFLLGGWGDVYQIGDNNEGHHLEHFDTDDGHRNDGDYELSWEEDGVMIHYDFGSGDGYNETLWVEFKE